MVFKSNVGRAAAAGAVLLLSAGVAWGQERATGRPLRKNAGAAATNQSRPDTQPAQTAKPKTEEKAANYAGMTLTSVVLEAIDGKVVGYKRSAEGAITPAKVGDKLQEGAELILGCNAAVRVRVGASQLFTFDHAGKSVFRVARNDGKTDITRIDVDQGRVTFDVTATKYANDVRIEAPEMTLAIKGTIGGVEVTPGHPTVAFGDLRNHGRIEVDWPGGRRVNFTGNERSDALTQDPAKFQDRLATVSTKALRGHEDQEQLLDKRSTGGAEAASKELGTTSIPNDVVESIPNLPLGTHPGGPGTPRPGSVLHIDSATGELFETDDALRTSLLRQGLSVDPSASMGGDAIVTNVAGGEPVLVRLETFTSFAGSVKNRFLGLDLNDGTSDFERITDIEGPAATTPALNGLGALRDELYGVGRLGGQDAVYRVDLNHGQLAPVMNMGVTLEGALAGGNERGTLFAFGIEAGHEGDGGSLLDHGALLEIDPRTNYLVDVHSGLNGAFDSGAGNGSPSLADLGDVQAITGLAYANGVVTIGAVASSGGGRTALIQFDPAAGGTSSGPAIRGVQYTPEAFTNGLASENGASPAPSVTLANPPGTIDTTSISAVFAQMAYSSRAWQSGFVDRAMSAEIVRNAVDPAGCIASGALSNLHQLLGGHVDQVAGVGRTSADFQAMLPAGHPCRCRTH